MMRHKLYTWRTECHSKSYRLPVVVGDLLFDWWTSALICSSALICNSSGRQSCICLLVHRSLLYPSFYAHVALSCGDDHLRGKFVQVEPPDAFSSMTIRRLRSCRIFFKIARQVQYLVGFPGFK